MTVSSDRTMDNYSDTQRKIPAAALAPSVLTGLAVERIVAPASGATVVLSQAAEAIAHIQAHKTADGLAPATGILAPLPTTHYTVVLEGAVSGVAEITEAATTDRSAETWTVWYVPKSVDPTPGGQTAI